MTKSIFKSWREGSVLVTDAGWGDSGKGKVVSALSPQIACKVIGGHNAGHTVVTDKGELGLGLIPSSVVHSGVLNIIGQEVVLNPVFLIEEINKINKFGIKLNPSNLQIDFRSHLVFPWHEVRDALSEEARGSASIGSLHLGIGWTYSDRINRRGLRLSDILSPDWKDLVKKEYETQSYLIEDMKKDVKRKTGQVSKVKGNPDLSDIITLLTHSRKILGKFAGYTNEAVWKAIDRKARILFEDSHGAMLDVAHGSWPFTTGVNTGLAGVYRSFGGKAVKSINKIIVCTKAYQTRVGGGPMPTEDFGKLAKYLQVNGHEVGTRSGRVRRCGAIDIPLLRYGYDTLGLGSNDEIAITKLDVLTGLTKIPVCVKYKLGSKKVSEPPSSDALVLAKARPVFKKLPGWKEDLSKIKSFSKLPEEAQKYINNLEKMLARKITFIGVGKHEHAYLVK